MLKFCLKTLLFLALFLQCFVASAADKRVEVRGNERLEASEVTSRINLASLKKYSDASVAEALKKLYESDLFAEVKIYKINDQIIIEVKENPIISEVKFVGNKKLEDEALQAEVSLKKREIFSKAKLENDLKRINDIYLKSGRFLTQIDPKIIQKSQNRIELIFDITEGPKAKIGSIYFVGNQAFSDEDLNAEISTKESKWWKFLSSSDTYDSDRMEFDKEKLRRFYTANGYADFAVVSAVAQISPQKDSFFMTFLLEEGIKYDFGEINIVNHVEKFDSSVLEKEILIKKGKLYNADLMEKTIERMVEVMSEKSYAFANIEPVLKRNREEKIIDIDFVIRETPRIYINQIHISGNTRTMDEVIRRELRLRDGDPYNQTKINRSKQRLENLGFFEKVDFKTKRLGDSDKVDLDIEVKEKKTGEINLGIGYSTVNKVTANAGVRERNLFGTGQELGVNVQKSFINSSYELNYTKPYFMGRAIDVGFDIFQYQMQKRYSFAYDQQSQGITFRGNYSITEFLGHQLRYSYSTQDIGSIDSTASFSIRALQGSYATSSIGHSLIYDKRDNRLNPKKGYYFSLSQDYAGVGGDIKNLRHEGSAGLYVPTFSNDFIFKALVRGGSVKGIGQDVRSNNGFFLGGNNFRGFQYAGMGPRTKNASGSAVGGDIIGGKTYYVGTLEYTFPLGLPKELGINGILFTDNGTVKGVDPKSRAGADIADSGALRSSYGLSIAWASPMGPIRLDFAKVAKKQEYDQTQNFRFSFGTTF